MGLRIPFAPVILPTMFGVNVAALALLLFLNPALGSFAHERGARNRRTDAGDSVGKRSTPFKYTPVSALVKIDESSDVLEISDSIDFVPHSHLTLPILE